MAVQYKICFDCADPHRLARFWAEALGYVVEDNSPLIEQLLSAGVVAEDDFVEVEGQKEWKTVVAIRDPDHPVDQANGIGLGGRVLFQTVPEAKSVKNRVHLDLRHGPDGIEADVARLEGLGATRVGEGSQGAATWVVLADPEGNEFCVN